MSVTFAPHASPYMTHCVSSATEGYRASAGASVFAPKPWPVEVERRYADPLPAGVREFFDGEPAMCWSEGIDGLLEMLNWEDDWDGFGAAKPIPSAVRQGLHFAQALRQRGIRPPDRVLAGVNGTVVFEWYVARGYYSWEWMDGVEAHPQFLPRSDTR